MTTKSCLWIKPMCCGKNLHVILAIVLGSMAIGFSVPGQFVDNFSPVGHQYDSESTWSDQETNRSSAVRPSSGDYVGLKRVYPNLRFERPVYLTGSGDGSGRMFVVEQDGVIRVIPGPSADNDPTSIKQTKVFLDIREKISRRGNEEGLLGLAFHPEFVENGKFYIHYSQKSNEFIERRGRRIPKTGPGVIAMYRVTADDPDQADPTSEQRILVQEQPFPNHNGGMIEFGPDGFLYITFGDGGSANDPLGSGQDMSTMLGSIIRIDVDKISGDRQYTIPTDNPFVGIPYAAPELWAIGLRNVWRFSFDRKDGTLYAADVGQNKIEEVNVIEKGGNYGWNRFEANEIFDDKTELVHGQHASPVALYDHSWGISITGGYVYRGNDYPELQGKYFYGDYASGNLWTLTKTADGAFDKELVRRTGRSIASFGEDDRGELYLLSFDGGIYQIVTTDEPENQFADWPKKLSESDLYTSIRTKKLADDLIPYSVNAPFWSDNADKGRYIRLPQGTAMKYAESGSWQLPVGAIVVKNFHGFHLRGQAQFETRLIKRTESGWEAATYVWNLDGSDAELVPEGRQFETYQRGTGQWKVSSWHAPSSSECASCHVDAAGFVLGLNTAQLNTQVDGENQILKWADQGILELPDSFNIETAARFHDPMGSEGDLQDRARVYLDVNCAMCHQPNGPGNAKIDLRYTTDLTNTRMLGHAPAQGNMGISDSLIVAPGDPDKSLLLYRIQTLGAGRMPNIGSNQIDEKGAALLREWINSL